jgi:hypothetical protein
MKTLKIYSILVLLAAFAVGCGSGVEHILPQKDGTWISASIAMRSYVNSTLDSSWTVVDGSSYTFEKGGAVTKIDSSGTSRTLTWSVNPDGDIVELCSNSASSHDCQLYLVVNSSKNSQQWKATIVGAVNGEWTEQDLSLTRVQ